MAKIQQTLSLGKNVQIPSLGFGTWQLTGKTAQEATETALQIGYRHIDTAKAYGNHHEVAQAIKNSGLARSEFFLTTKVWRTDLAYQDVLEATKLMLEELETNYFDLLLVHWPNPDIPIAETMKAFSKLEQDSLIKTIGVSNFTISRLQEALATGAKITNNQVEYHPSLNQQALKDFCDQNDIVLTAYSPIAQGDDLQLPTIQTLAQKYGKSASQVILNWIMAKGMVAIPRSANPKHIKDNFESLNWQLKPEDVKAIDQIGGNNRIVDPGFVAFN